MKWRHRRTQNQDKQSPPSRGAWIEMETVVHREELMKVAPLAGGVD